MASADRSTLFINATILDGSEHMEPQPDMAVAVERGVITWMGPSAVAQVPAGAEVIDLAGAYLMPGLINMHVHLCGSGKPVSAGDAGALMKKLDNPVGRAIVRHILKGSAQQQLASGVTTVRGAGDPLFADLAVRDAIDAGKYQGPRLVAPGTGVTVPGGHGAGLFAQVANRPVEAAEQVRHLYARGADVIKLFVTGGVFDATEVGEPGVLRMPVEVATAACKAAHEVGLPVMAHVESTEGVKAALEAGVDTSSVDTRDFGAVPWRRGHAARGACAECDLHYQPGAAVCVARPGKDPFDRYTKEERRHRVLGHHRERPCRTGSWR